MLRNSWNLKSPDAPRRNVHTHVLAQNQREPAPEASSTQKIKASPRIKNSDYISAMRFPKTLTKNEHQPEQPEDETPS